MKDSDVTATAHGASPIDLMVDAVKWRYVHIDDVTTYESAGWIHAGRHQTTRNQFFVLMLKD